MRIQPSRYIRAWMVEHGDPPAINTTGDEFAGSTSTPASKTAKMELEMEEQQPSKEEKTTAPAADDEKMPNHHNF